MHKPVKIIAILVLAGVMISLPLLLNVGHAYVEPELSLDTPTIKTLTTPECIESRAYMQANHMQLLDEWRDAVVREGSTTFINSTGQPFEMSLDETCLDCHSNRTEFCDTCHEFMDVKPYCWDCHTGGSGSKEA
jgi:hypothetical protein